MSQVQKPTWLSDIDKVDAKTFRLTIERIYDWWNLHNGGQQTWDTVNATNATITNLTAGGSVGPFLPLAGGTLTGNLIFNPTTKGVKGTTTNDNAAAGNVGEYISATASAVNFPTSGQYGDLTSISLTAGDWDVTGIVLQDAGTTTASWRMGISQTSGNSGTGLVLGDNLLLSPPTTSTYDTTLTLAGYRQSLSTTTIIYLKYNSTYTVGTPQAYGRISARRVR